MVGMRLNDSMAIFVALCCAVVYGIGDWCGGRAARRQVAVMVALLGQCVSLVLVGVVVAVMQRAAPSLHDWIWAGGGGVVGAIGLICLYHGLANGDITVVAPVSAVVGASLPVGIGLLQGERPGALQLVGVVLGVAHVLVHDHHHHDHEHGEHCDHPSHAHDHGHGHHHHHDDDVKSFVFKATRPFDPAKLEDFLGAMVNVYGPRMLRYKGVLHMKGTERKVIFQGVHQLMGSDLGPEWASNEPRMSKMVFIGIELPKDIFLQGLEQCLN